MPLRPSKLSFLLTGLNGATTYIVTIHANTSAGNGNLSTIKFDTESGPRKEIALWFHS